MREEGQIGVLALLCLATVALIFGVILIIDSNTSINNIERVKVEGEVTNVKVFDDYLLVTFNNNSDETYKINYPSGFGGNTLDFTVNSKLIVKLSRCTENGIILKWKDDFYNVDSIVKIPDNLEEG